MRKELLKKIINEITLEEIVRCSENVTATKMGGKKYYYFINGSTKNVNNNTKKKWCELLEIEEHELEQIMKNQIIINKKL